MFESLETILFYLWDHIFWWAVLTFIIFCIIDAILPEKHRKEEDLEEYLK